MIMKYEVSRVNGCGFMSGRMRRKDIQKYILDKDAYFLKTIHGFSLKTRFLIFWIPKYLKPCKTSYNI